MEDHNSAKERFLNNLRTAQVLRLHSVKLNALEQTLAKLAPNLYGEYKEIFDKLRDEDKDLKKIAETIDKIMSW